MSVQTAAFWIAFAALVVLGGCLVVSVLWPARRIWPPPGRHSWQQLAKPQNLSIPWVIISLPLPLGETASPRLRKEFAAGGVKHERVGATEDISPIGPPQR